MNNFLKWALIIVGGLFIIGFVGLRIMKHQTKKASPEATVSYDKDGLKVDIFYNRPYKKGRQIFGGLVPYGEVWRTGANEATTFTTDQELTIGGQKLPAGHYTLWTIPGATEWTVIFNSRMYGWGVDFNRKASRDPSADVLQVKEPVMPTSGEVEEFTISMQDAPVPTLVLEWDRTRIAVPLK
ncbi:MAG: DUF2911 domain-containing protein [Flavobacteriales bacterium]